MDDEGRAHELIYRAVRELATGAMPLHQRLRDAWVYHLALLELPGVPWPDLAERYRDIADYCRTDPKTGALIIEESDIDDQRRIAGEIVELYASLCARLSD